MFAPEELSDFRDVANGSLPGMCDVLRDVRVVQPDRSWTEEEQTVLSGVSCRKVPTNQTPQELLAGQTTTTRFVTTFILDATAQIYADDVLLYLGKRYPVAGVLDRTEQIYLHVMVYDDSKP